jgi:hypothetical protein
LPTPQTTVQADHGPEACSATAFGPQIVNGTLSYGGGSSCAGQINAMSYKMLDIRLYIEGANGQWSMRDFIGGPTPAGYGTVRSFHNGLRVQPGRAFKAVVTAVLFEPNGWAGCSQHNQPFPCSQLVTVTASSPVKRAMSDDK